MTDNVEKTVETTETTEQLAPTVPIEKSTVETTEETTTSVPAHEEVRETHRVSGQPQNAVTETTTVEETTVD